MSDLLPALVHRQFYHELSSLSELAFDLNCAIVPLDSSISHGQPQACALTFLLGGEKGSKIR